MTHKYCERKPGIYLIINIKNSKVYVGSSLNVRKRIIGHISLFKQNKHHNMYMQKAYNSCENCFRVKILECVKNVDTLEKRELYWINFYKSYKAENGYNICKVPNTTKGYKHSSASKSKMSQNRRGLTVGENNPFYNKKHSDETKKAISKSNIGKLTRANNPKFNTGVDNELIIKLYNEGLNRNQIAKKLNLPHSLICRRVKWYLEDKVEYEDKLIIGRH